MLLDGKKLNEKILAEVKEEVEKLNYIPKLGVVLVGDDPASVAYVEKKKKIGEDIGIKVKVYKFPENISTNKLRKEVSRICRIPTIKGVLVQLPLPEHINTTYILNAILPKKDVDMLSRDSAGRLYQHASWQGQSSPMLPATVSGIVKLLEEYDIKTEKKHVVIVGYGTLVGKPASLVLKNMGATVSIIDEKTPEETKNTLLKEADIVISGVGKADLITGDMLKKGVVVVDAGTSLKDGKLVGDISPEVQKIASYYTPVPGGIGPMTIAMLFYNFIKLTKNK